MSENKGTLEGWKVTFAGTGINLALGVLYTWSLFKGAIETELGWEFIQIYGLTETTPLLTMNRSRDEFDHLLPAERAAKVWDSFSISAKVCLNIR